MKKGVVSNPPVKKRVVSNPPQRPGPSQEEAELNTQQRRWETEKKTLWATEAEMGVIPSLGKNFQQAPADPLISDSEPPQL